MPIRVRSIHIYPVKSLRGIDVQCAVVEKRGLRNDRRYMVVSPEDIFLTQRNLPMMATVSTALSDDGLTLAKNGSSLFVSFDDEAESLAVAVWQNVVLASRVSNEADEWLTDALGTPCRLVKMNDTSFRSVHASYSIPGDEVSFADGFPLLLTNAASLDDLNTRTDTAFPMNRFRPSVVVEGAEPWAEDGWPLLEIGGASFRNAKPCGRCQVIATDQVTGERGVEPLHTLATFRKNGNSVDFGVYLIPDSFAEIAVGDEVRV